jgi:hypothetical protein
MACRVRDLPYWLADELWRVELDDMISEPFWRAVGGRAVNLLKLPPWAARPSHTAEGTIPESERERSSVPTTRIAAVHRMR